MLSRKHLPTLAAIIALLACRTEAALAQTSPRAAAITQPQFMTLRWLVGSWHGSEEGGAPFTFADSTARQASDSGTITLRKGRVSTGTLRWMDSEGKPQKRVYTMRRLSAAK